jgi:phosphopentomutase
MIVDRVVLLVLDGVGVGALPDAADYGDTDADSVGNTARALGGLTLPNLGELGLGNLTGIQGVTPRRDTRGAYGKMAEQSRGKDSIAGHWELCGVITERQQPLYPNGFPAEIIDAFERAIGRQVLGNYPASGTEIIARLGPEHMHTGKPIVYTSGDSVFQVAAHEDVISVDELYRACEIARALLQGDHAVGRVIARPFTGVAGAFTRTERRKDWSLEPPGITLPDCVAAAGMDVMFVGKIDDIVGRRSLTHDKHTANNLESLDATLEFLHTGARGLIFSNLIEFDQIWGHRNDPRGYAGALEAFDRRLPELYAAMRATDLLFITGDHGCDPVTPSTDHSREYVPLLVTGAACRPGTNLGTRVTFADAGQTICDLLGAQPLAAGTSFAPEITR